MRSNRNNPAAILAGAWRRKILHKLKNKQIKTKGLSQKYTSLIRLASNLDNVNEKGRKRVCKRTIKSLLS